MHIHVCVCVLPFVLHKGVHENPWVRIQLNKLDIESNIVESYTFSPMGRSETATDSCHLASYSVWFWFDSNRMVLVWRISFDSESIYLQLLPLKLVKAGTSMEPAQEQRNCTAVIATCKVALLLLSALSCARVICLHMLCAFLPCSNTPPCLCVWMWMHACRCSL